VVLG
jgi:hypothetical protein